MSQCPLLKFVKVGNPRVEAEFWCKTGLRKKLCVNVLNEKFDMKSKISSIKSFLQIVWGTKNTVLATPI